jgi:peptidoglycan/LPS O-acetylase OafA/YrhL
VIAALSRGDFVFPGWTIFLGNASFAIYLTHLPAMNALAIPLAKLGVQAWVPPMAVFVPLAMFGVCVGAAFHVAVERPLLARLAAYRRRDARATS